MTTSVPQIDTGKALGEMLLEMAVAFGSAVYPDDGGPATLPAATTEDYRVLLTAFNRGYSRFLRAEHWSFLSRPLEITTNADGTGPLNIDGGAARYRLPHWARMGPAGSGNWRYIDDLAYYDEIISIPHEEAISLLNNATGSGPPARAGIGPVQGRGGTGAPETDVELVLWPTPNAAYRIRATFYLRNHRLTSLAQRHIAGAEHDEAILCQAMWALYETDVAAPERDGTLLAATNSLKESKAMDARSDLGLKGQLRDPRMSQAPDQYPGSLGERQQLYVNGIRMQLP